VGELLIKQLLLCDLEKYDNFAKCWDSEGLWHDSTSEEPLEIPDGIYGFYAGKELIGYATATETYGWMGEMVIADLAKEFEGKSLPKTEMEISMIMRPDVRYKGYGSFFLSELMSRLSEEYHVDEAAVYVSKTNQIAISFFVKNGFDFVDADHETVHLKRVLTKQKVNELK